MRHTSLNQKGLWKSVLIAIMLALHFGSGNIGRGFIGKLLAKCGHDVVFTDIVPVVVNELKSRLKYKVNIVGAEGGRSEEVTIKGAVFSNSDEVLEQIAKADLITTAVGPRTLERIAPTIARGLKLRMENGNDKPLNIIACENAIRATTSLKGFVIGSLDPAAAQWVQEHVGFADCAVDRIVPPARHDDILEVTVEDFSEWVVDETQLKKPSEAATLPPVKYTDNLPAFIERKLLTVNTGHAITAYLGRLYGFKDIRTSIEDPKIRSIVEGAMKESGMMLCRRYGLNEEEHMAYIGKIIGRFANPHIVDDVTRVGREPLRKLSAEDRLIKPLRGCMEYNLPYTNLAKGIAAALMYTDPTDQQAVQLQEMIATKGWQAVLEEVSGLSLKNADNALSKVGSARQELGDLVAQI